MGIEPTYSARKADVLPLNYTRLMKVYFNYYTATLHGREDRI